MNWSFGASPFVIFLAVAVLAAAGYISFLNWRRSGRRRTVGWLEGLRFVLIAMLAFTLLRPEVVRTIKSKDQPEVAILIDRSGSMATRDVQDGASLQSRRQWLDAQLTNEFWRPLAGNTKVVIEEFDGSVTNAPGETNAAGPIGTDLNAALERPLARAANLKAALIVTDGDWNIGGSPLRAASQYRERGVPKDEAEKRAWMTVNLESGGGKLSGSGRGRKETHVASSRGGRAQKSGSWEQRSAAARKGWVTRRKHEAERRRAG